MKFLLYVNKYSNSKLELKEKVIIDYIEVEDGFNSFLNTLKESLNIEDDLINKLREKKDLLKVIDYIHTEKEYKEYLLEIRY